MENELSNQNRKQIRRLMEEPSWAGFEAFVKVFREKQFINSSAKRATEFDTVWYMAEQEGGKRVLAQFIKELEEEANKAND
jgi:hypothetical protein